MGCLVLLNPQWENPDVKSHLGAQVTSKLRELCGPETFIPTAATKVCNHLAITFFFKKGHQLKNCTKWSRLMDGENFLVPESTIDIHIALKMGLIRKEHFGLGYIISFRHSINKNTQSWRIISFSSSVIWILYEWRCKSMCKKRLKLMSLKPICCE